MSKGESKRAVVRTLIASDGVRLAYRLDRCRDGGSGLLLLLHGAASNHTRWSELVAHTVLRRSWDLLRPDLRGNGESMTRRGQKIAVWCRDLLEILDAERVRRAVVIGHSLGAQLGIHLASSRPERVRALVLIDPVFRRALVGWQRTLSRYSWLVAGVATVIAWLNRLGLGRRHFENRDLWELDRETRLALAGDDSFEQIAREYTALGPILRSMPTANYLRQLVATVSPLPPLETIDLPVLVLLSGGITFADLAVNRAEAARFPDHRVVELEANHWPLTEAPEQVRDEIERWVGGRFPASGIGSDTVEGRTERRDE